MLTISRAISLVTISLLAIGHAGGATSPATSHERGTLIIEVHGAATEKGTVRMALDPSAETFLKDMANHPEWRSLSAPGGQETVRIEVSNVAFGTYALRGFYDVNDNEKLDTNLLGIPAEAYGFSNDARRWFGPPKFEDAAFAFSGDQQVVTVVLSHHIKTPSVGVRVPEKSPPAVAPSRS